MATQYSVAIKMIDHDDDDNNSERITGAKVEHGNKNSKRFRVYRPSVR